MTLLSGIAHRVMYELSYDGLSFNFISARWIAETGKELVYYIMLAMIDELKNWDKCPDKYFDKKQKAIKDIEKFNIDKIEEYKERSQLLIECFEAGSWERYFGGKAWGRVGRAELQLVNKYEEYIKVKGNYDEREEEILRKIIIDINLIEGKMHNTGTMMAKVFRMEKDMNGGSFDDFVEAKNIRAVSEFGDVGLIYRSIEKYLYPKNIYSETINKIIINPSYINVQDPINEIAKINERKQFIENVNKNIDVVNIRIREAEEFINSTDEEFEFRDEFRIRLLNAVNYLYVSVVSMNSLDKLTSLIDNNYLIGYRKATDEINEILNGIENKMMEYCFGNVIIIRKVDISSKVERIIFLSKEGIKYIKYIRDSI